MTIHPTPRRTAGRFSHSFPLLQQRRLVEHWPDADREAWEQAIAQGGPFTAAGPAAHLATSTQRARSGSYGQFLSFLDAMDELHEDDSPEERVTPKRLGGYLASLQARVCPRTAQQQIRELACTLKAMFPKCDWGWVVRHPAMPSAAEIRLARQPKPTIDVPAVYAAVLSHLMLLQDKQLTNSMATDYRDHLIVGLTACRPLRLRNLAAMRLDHNLLEEDVGFRLVFTRAETKTGAAVDQTVPQPLQPHLRWYLGTIRSFLLSGEEHDLAWVGRNGRPLQYGGVKRCFERVGIRLTGLAFSPHAFRHAAVTTVIDNDPRDLDIAAALLTHRSMRTTNENYDHSNRNAGAELWHAMHRKLRRAGRE